MNLDIFKPKAPPLFGLDISSSSVKMLEIVDAGKGAYRVERYAIEPLPREAVVDGNINNLEAVAEARQVMLSTKNLLSPSDGEPVVAPTLDMVLPPTTRADVHARLRGGMTKTGVVR